MINDINNIEIEGHGPSPIAQEFLKQNSSSGFTDNFKRNLALDYEPEEMQRVGQQLSEKINFAIQDRASWCEIIKKGYHFLGAPNEVNVSLRGGEVNKIKYHASTFREVFYLTHSKIYQTIFAGDRIVTCSIQGQTDDNLQDKAERIEYWFNYYLNNVDKEFKSNKAALIFWQVLAGSAFTKTFIDPLKNRPVIHYIHPQDIILSPGCSGIHDSEIIGREFNTSYHDLHARMKAGQYKYVDFQSDFYGLEKSSVQRAIGESIGAKGAADNIYNKRFTLYEVCCWLKTPDSKKTGKYMPYVVTYEKETKKIIGWYRNWDENDAQCQMINDYTEYKLYDNGGPYGIGLSHLILDLCNAETTILDELIRAGQLSNSPPMFYSKNVLRPNETNNISLEMGKLIPLESMSGNINDAFASLPIKEPSQTLFTLGQDLSERIRKLGMANSLDMNNMPANMSATAVASVMANLNTLEDPVINRLYDSLKHEMSLLYYLFGSWLPQEPYPFNVPGIETVIMRDDFIGDIIVQPGFDKNAYSQITQINLSQAILDLSSTYGNLFNARKVVEFRLKAMRVPDYESLLVPDDTDTPPPPEMDPVSENNKALKKQPVKAYKTQDHASHIQIHQSLVTSLNNDSQSSQNNTSVPPPDPSVISALQSHIQEHEAFKYLNSMEAKLGESLPEDPAQIPPDIQNQIAFELAQKLENEQEQQRANQPPDPGQLMLQELKVKEMEAQNQRFKIEQQAKIDSSKLEHQTRLEEFKFKLEQRRLVLEEQKIKNEMQKNALTAQIETSKLEMQQNNINLSHEIDIEKEKMKLKIQSDKIEKEDNNKKLSLENEAYKTTLGFETKNKERETYYDRS